MRDPADIPIRPDGTLDVTDESEQLSDDDSME